MPQIKSSLNVRFENELADNKEDLISFYEGTNKIITMAKRVNEENELENERLKAEVY